MFHLKCQGNKSFSKIKKWILDQELQDWIRWIVLVACIVVVYIQILDCCQKLKNPPVTSHSTLALNDSLDYPAVTVCREPPYNKRVFPKFNFPADHIGSFPYSSFWKNFPYDEYNVSDFWAEAVYNQSVLMGYALDQRDVDLTSSINLQSGMCHTIRPLHSVSSVGKKSGYAILLKHDLYDYKPLVDEEPGWKIFIHEPLEKFSENVNLMSSRQDHIFVPVGETTEVSLDAYQFYAINNCSNDFTYGETECEEKCTIDEDIVSIINCTGPWLPNMDKPLCNNYNDMRILLKATLTMRNKNCCLKKCKSTHYKSFVVKRTPHPTERKRSSSAFIFFSSKTVITLEEKYSYGWGDFLGEIGGTIGFLLGLSIIGVIGLVSNAITFLLHHRKDKLEDNCVDFSEKNASIINRFNSDQQVCGKTVQTRRDGYSIPKY